METPRNLQLQPTPNIADALAIYDIGTDKSALPPVPGFDGDAPEIHEDTKRLELPKKPNSTSIFTVYVTRNANGSVRIMLNERQLLADFRGPIDGMDIGKDGLVTAIDFSFGEKRDPQVLWDFILAKVSEMDAPELKEPEVANLAKVINLRDWVRKRGRI